MNKLYLLIIVALAACSKPQKAVDSQISTNIPVVIGTYTQKEGHVDGKGIGIYHYMFDTVSGKLQHVTSVDGVINPSYVAAHAGVNMVITASETASGKVFAYQYDSISSTLKKTDEVPSNGDYPCHVSIHPSGKYAFVANYGTGSITAYHVNENNQLQEFWTTTHEGRGKSDRQTSAHAHMVWFDSKKSDQLFAVDLGIDQVKVYTISDSSLSSAYDIKFPPRAGPRQLAFHPAGDAYVINELSGTVSLLQKDSAGQYTHVKAFNALNSIKSTTDAGAADIQITPTGDFLYASIRGSENSIAMFSINQQNGKLTLLGHQTAGGQTPRAIKIDPTGKFLLVLNQDTGNIITYKIQSDGQLKDIGVETKVPTPVSLAFLK